MDAWTKVTTLPLLATLASCEGTSQAITKTPSSRVTTCHVGRPMLLLSHNRSPSHLTQDCPGAPDSPLTSRSTKSTIAGYLVLTPTLKKQRMLLGCAFHTCPLEAREQNGSKA
jgi:hypothetical protein